MSSIAFMLFIRIPVMLIDCGKLKLVTKNNSYIASNSFFSFIQLFFTKILMDRIRVTIWDAIRNVRYTYASHVKPHFHYIAIYRKLLLLYIISFCFVFRRVSITCFFISTKVSFN